MRLFESDRLQQQELFQLSGRGSSLSPHSAGSKNGADDEALEQLSTNLKVERMLGVGLEEQNDGGSSSASSAVAAVGTGEGDVSIDATHQIFLAIANAMQSGSTELA